MDRNSWHPVGVGRTDRRRSTRRSRSRVSASGGGGPGHPTAMSGRRHWATRPARFGRRHDLSSMSRDDRVPLVESCSSVTGVGGGNAMPHVSVPPLPADDGTHDLGAVFEADSRPRPRRIMERRRAIITRRFDRCSRSGFLRATARGALAGATSGVRASTVITARLAAWARLAEGAGAAVVGRRLVGLGGAIGPGRYAAEKSHDLSRRELIAPPMSSVPASASSPSPCVDQDASTRHPGEGAGREAPRRGGMDRTSRRGPRGRERRGSGPPPHPGP